MIFFIALTRKKIQCMGICDFCSHSNQSLEPAKNLNCLLKKELEGQDLQYILEKFNQVLTLAESGKPVDHKKSGVDGDVVVFIQKLHHHHQQLVRRDE
jgi:hypothetical protein